MISWNRNKTSILLFHRVSPIKDIMWQPMDPVLFEQILIYAKRKFHIVPLNDLIFKRNKKSSKPFAAITFDDGYSDFLHFAAPILKKHNIPSTLFVVTDCIDKNIPTWTYLSDHYFLSTNKLNITLTHDFKNLPSRFQISSWENKMDRIKYGKEIKQFLKGIPFDLRNNILQSFIESFNDVKPPFDLMLSWDDLRDLQSNGVEVGAHSVHHPTLATVESDKELKYELEHSKKRIQLELDEVSPVFSYPCGSFDERVKKFTEQAGFRAALAVKGKTWQKKEIDLFEIPRIELYNESMFKTKMRISGNLNLLKKIFSY